jgi:tetratricopeptide (TPR) repeat protein
MYQLAGEDRLPRLPALTLVYAIIIISALAAIYKFLTDPHFLAIFLPFFEGRAIDPGYSIFSVKHLLDIFNEIIIISPLVIILLPVFWTGIKRISKSRVGIYLSLSALGGIIYLFGINPALTMPRDWDLFSFTLFPLTIIMITRFWDIYQKSLNKFTLSLLLFLLISCIPFLATNLNREASIRYFEYTISLDYNKSLSSLVVLTDYYRDRGDTLKIDSINKVYESQYPNKVKCDRALAALNRGDVNAAGKLIDEIEPDELDPSYQRIMGRYNFLKGNLDSALTYINKAIDLRSHAARYFLERARIRFTRGEGLLALDDLREAYRLDRTDLQVLDGLAFVYSATEQYDSTIYYAGKMLEVDSLVPVAYYWLARSYALKGDIGQASNYAERYYQFNLTDPAFLANKKELAELIGI